jgi:hypothetical protein
METSEDPDRLESLWLLQRDISVQLFKVMMGVVRSAADLARKVRAHESHQARLARVNTVNTLNDSDLELAFSGDARGGYQWLNCLAKDECDWVWSAVNNEDISLDCTLLLSGCYLTVSNISEGR